MSQNSRKYFGKKCNNFIKILFNSVKIFENFFKFCKKTGQFMNKSPKMPKYAANMQNLAREIGRENRDQTFVSAYEICADNF